MSLSVIIFIVVKKFSVLANVDIDNIQAEQEAIFKEQIISNRLKRNMAKWSSWLIRAFRVISNKSIIFSKWFYNKLHELKERYRNEEVLPIGSREEKIKELFIEVEELLAQSEYDRAEKMLVEIIGLDSQNLEAFKKLSQLYLDNKNYEDAKQTLGHILKLSREKEGEQELSEIYFDLFLASRALDDFDEALVNIKEALVIEPNNPRYLDNMLETSIIKKDKALALETYKKLGAINPENKKLRDFKKQISRL